MPVSLGYDDVFADILIEGGLIFFFLLPFAYRLLAASALPRLRNAWLYTLLCLSLVVVMGQMSKIFSDETQIREKLLALLFLVVLMLPSFVVGFLGLARKWRWQSVLISCVIELLAFPFWFVTVFLVALELEGGD